MQHLQSHVRTLWIAITALFILTLLLSVSWWSAPQLLTIHVPPDLRSGSTRKWWEIPPELVYTFTFYIFQLLNHCPHNGEEDFPHQNHAPTAYLMPRCEAHLRQVFATRRDSGELRQRVRGMYEIPGRGYGEEPTQRVRLLSRDQWIVRKQSEIAINEQLVSFFRSELSSVWQAAR